MGGRTSTTWGPGSNPVKRKGQRHRSTLLKEQLGLAGWASLEDFLLTEGADVLLQKLRSIRSPVEYIKAYTALLEFVKPKMSRVDASVNDGGFAQFMTYDVPDELFTVEELRILAKDSANAPAQLAARFIDACNSGVISQT